MTQLERENMLAKLEELEHRCGALAAAAKLIEGELRQIQSAFWKQTAKEDNK